MEVSYFEWLLALIKVRKTDVMNGRHNFLFFVVHHPIKSVLLNSKFFSFRSRVDCKMWIAQSVQFVGHAHQTRFSNDIFGELSLLKNCESSKADATFLNTIPWLSFPYLAYTEACRIFCNNVP